MNYEDFDLPTRGKPKKKVLWREDHELVLRGMLALGAPATDQQIRDRLTRQGIRISSSGCRTRRNELAEDFGYVCKLGRGVTEAGRPCAKWWLTTTGKDKAIELREKARQGRLVA